MKLALDVSAVPSRPAGAGRYVFELARHLSDLSATDLETFLFARNDDASRWETIASRSEGRMKVNAAAPPSRPRRLLWEQLRLPSLLAKHSMDVHHAPHYTMPERSKVPVVVTIHDMTFFTNPEWHERSKVVIFRRAIKQAVKHASQLIAVSNDTAARLRQRFGEVPITVIPHGLDHNRFNTQVKEGERGELTAAGIPGDYIAFVGTIEPRKNLPRLVQAFELIATKHPSLHLVIAGQHGWGTEEFDRLVAASKYRDRIVLPGYLTEHLVPALLRNARAVAYPSLVEGFGLPALEAMACGTPVVVGQGSAMQEVAAGAGIFVEQADVSSLADGLEEALVVNGEVGVVVARRFTWAAAADAHLAVYEKAAAGG